MLTTLRPMTFSSLSAPDEHALSASVMSTWMYGNVADCVLACAEII